MGQYCSIMLAKFMLFLRDCGLGKGPYHFALLHLFHNKKAHRYGQRQRNQGEGKCNLTVVSGEEVCKEFHGLS